MVIKDSFGRFEQYVLHLPGEGKKYLGYYLDKLKDNTIRINKTVTLITTATEDVEDKCPLICQLNRSSQNYINSAEGYSGEWKKITKLPLIVNALNYVETEYVLLLDANDVALLKDVDHAFISKWKEYDCDILYNGSQYLYPKLFSAPLEQERNSPFVNHYLNAGVCFGYTEKLKQLYEKAYYHSQHEHYAPYDSEQYYVRIGIVECSDVNVKIDDGSHLFLCSHGN